MAYLLDTSILIRLQNTLDKDCVTARNAVSELHREGQILNLTPQNIVEFWNVATRPADVNGLGLATHIVDSVVEVFERRFPLLTETMELYPVWKKLVLASGASGKQVHDARLVAVCQVYGISRILTFNIGHFKRLAQFVKGLEIVDPRMVP